MNFGRHRYHAKGAVRVTSAREAACVPVHLLIRADLGTGPHMGVEPEFCGPLRICFARDPMDDSTIEEIEAKEPQVVPYPTWFSSRTSLLCAMTHTAGTPA
jgi:hypothetical protein